MIKRYVYVTLQKEFIHQYKDAPEEVSYLRYPHRHIAHIKASIQVEHNDREIEFIMMKHYLEEKINLLGITTSSCEQIAEYVIIYLQERYGRGRDIKVEVSEDGENGCELFYAGDSFRNMIAGKE